MRSSGHSERFCRCEASADPSGGPALRQWGIDKPFYGIVDLDSPVLAGALSISGQPFAEMGTEEIFKRFGSPLQEREGKPPSLPSRRAISRA